MIIKLLFASSGAVAAKVFVWVDVLHVTLAVSPLSIAAENLFRSTLLSQVVSFATTLTLD